MQGDLEHPLDQPSHSVTNVKEGPSTDGQVIRANGLVGHRESGPDPPNGLAAQSPKPQSVGDHVSAAQRHERLGRGGHHGAEGHP